MDFALDGEQSALVDSVVRFVDREYGFEARQAISFGAEGFSAAHWATFAELGWLGAGLAEEQGGFGGGVAEFALIAEQLGKALVLEPFVPVVQALLVLAALPDFEGRAGMIDATVSGETRAVVVSGDIRAEGGRLSGTARLVVGASMADHLLVEVGNSLYLVDGHADGVARADYRLLDSRRASDIELSDVPATRLSDDAGSALAIGRDIAQVLLCAESLGAMEAALWTARDYVKTRQQFGRPVGQFQAVQFRMADMLVECELARSMLYQALAAIGAPDRSRGVAAAKAMISEAGLFVGRQAIQLHGGIGMTEECQVGHYYKRLFVNAHLFGAPDVQVERFIALG